MLTDLANDDSASIDVHGQGQSFALWLRIPSWAKQMKVAFNGKTIDGPHKNGYLILNRAWNDDHLVVTFDMPMEMVENGDKVAFKRGPIVFARDSRFADDIRKSIHISQELKYQKITSHSFPSRVVYRIGEGKESFLVCDYSSAGKNFDDPSSLLSVWLSY